MEFVLESLLIMLGKHFIKCHIIFSQVNNQHRCVFFFEGIYIKDKRIAKVVETPLFSTLRRQNKVIIRSNWLRNPSINLTDSLSRIIKAFQNPIWAEQARERLKQIQMLTKVATA